MRQQRSSRLVVAARGSIVWVLGLVVSCGGVVDGGERAAAEACAAGGGSWYDDGCGGARDACGVRVCGAAIGPGCQCDRPLECWDSRTQRCRPE